MSKSEVEQTERPRGRFSVALTTSLSFVAVLWIAEIVDTVFGHQLDGLGVRPRTFEGLLGVVFMPLLHADWMHLIGNSGPLLVLGFVIALSGPAEWSRVTSIVWVAAGLGTWLIGGANSLHIGASGIVFGWIVYLLLRGFFTRSPLQLVVGVVVLIGYGSILWGALPGQAGVSWQGHLCGAIGGAIAAIQLRRPEVRASLETRSS